MEVMWSYIDILTEGNHASFSLHTANNQVISKSLILLLHTDNSFPTQTQKKKLLAWIFVSDGFKQLKMRQ